MNIILMKKHGRFMSIYMFITWQVKSELSSRSSAFPRRFNSLRLCFLRSICHNLSLFQSIFGLENGALVNGSTCSSCCSPLVTQLNLSWNVKLHVLVLGIVWLFEIGLWYFWLGQKRLSVEMGRLGRYYSHRQITYSIHLKVNSLVVGTDRITMVLHLLNHVLVEHKRVVLILSHQWLQNEPQRLLYSLQVFDV